MKHIVIFLSASTLLAACGGEKPTSPNAGSSAAPSEATTPAKKAAIELTPIQRGKKIYARCRACHTLDQEGRHKVGPNLWDIYGSQAGAKEGYAYSKAMKASNIAWNPETMDGYLKKPAAFMPGNKMTFIGLKKQEDRDAVQAYMKSQTTP